MRTSPTPKRRPTEFLSNVAGLPRLQHQCDTGVGQVFSASDGQSSTWGKENGALPRLAVTLPVASVMLGVSRSTLYVLAGEGKLKAVKVGGRTLITTASIRDFLDGLPLAGIAAPRKGAA